MNKQSKDIQNGKILTGVVVESKTPKTIVVLVSTFTRHPLYKKAVRRTKRFAVHNEMADIAIGQTVNIAETKPLSRKKHFIVIGKVANV